jgi:hypothetical protein
MPLERRSTQRCTTWEQPSHRLVPGRVRRGLREAQAEQRSSRGQVRRDQISASANETANAEGTFAPVTGPLVAHQIDDRLDGDRLAFLVPPSCLAHMA